MYKPVFNKVLVEIDDHDAKWGSGNNDNLGGDAYREGKLLQLGQFVESKDYPADLAQDLAEYLESLIGKTIMWHEGHEAGTVFENDGKKYALVFWWDIIGVKE